MTSAAYSNLATVIGDTVLSVDPTDSASATGSGSANKKRRADTVETMPQQQQQNAKRLRGATKLKVAGWLLGKAEQPAARGSARGSGSGWHWRGRSSSAGRGRGGRHFAFPGWGGGEEDGGGSSYIVVAVHQKKKLQQFVNFQSTIFVYNVLIEQLHLLLTIVFLVGIRICGTLFSCFFFQTFTAINLGVGWRFLFSFFYRSISLSSVFSVFSSRRPFDFVL
jgi:hypothetical protein